jgi:type I restriction enzyme R subunit
VVIADEAHRSQYDFIDGFARHMRDALPQRLVHRLHRHADRARPTPTRARCSATTSASTTSSARCEDGATVPIYYESRLAKLELEEASGRRSTRSSRRLTEGEEVERKEKLKTKWAQLEAVVGADKRLALVARDIVEHFERGSEALDGKAMIVCMSRRICVDLYREIVRCARSGTVTTTSTARSRW